MRAILLLAVAGCALISVTARAEDMVGTNPTGIMCRDEKALADFAGPDGSVKRSVIADPRSAIFRRYEDACSGPGSGGITVHVLTKRTKTSIVTYNGQTWYVPNIDFMTPTPDCIKEGTRLTMVGKIGTGFKQTDEIDPKKGFRYPRLTLDQPVCYLGNTAEKAGRYVSLVGNGADAFKVLMKMVGQHVAVTGEVGSPDNGNQPPDAMMIFDPVVRPTP